ncbi:cupin domain-containing protein [Marinobacterium marinum]|uniref:Cupin domain-containing protein n=1 Tax=Marinobacterium marinum TaxID=2756129 RepID=A0A7W1WXX4_9GAMM|nr:cupin domain-containing protein [Marinobacterium marinum]MBA4502087.1 cupin domain-containing protein [Marinobacterium marinum]
MINEIHWGDLSAEQFLREYWQKKPLLIRNAFPDFTPCISADELAGLACEEDIESRLIETDVTDGTWALEHGPFSEERFSRLGNKPWTLLVQAVDHWVPEVAPLMQAFNFIPQWRRDDLMISYASDGGGVGPHYDNYDVFLLQAEGVRRWEFGGLFGEESPRRDDTPVMILPEWQAEQSADLNPGDMLYLPPRVGHNGVGVGDGCMTWSIGFRAPSQNEVLQGFTQALCDGLSSDLRYEDKDLQLQTQPGEIDASAIKRVHAIIQQHLNDTDALTRWFGCSMTEPKYPDLAGNDEPYTLAELHEALEAGAEIQANEGSRFAFVNQEHPVVILFADGHAFELYAPAAKEFALQLCAQEALFIQRDEAAETLLLQLLNQGSLYLNMA